MSSHVMCDLETLDTRPSAVILSIGACTLDPGSGEITDRFYRAIDLESCQVAGLTTSESTKKWWAQQSEEARSVFSDPDRVSLLQALSDFSIFLRMLPGGPTKVKLWGNGSDFDNVILSNAYGALNFDAPWRFYNNRCYRTVRNCLKHHYVAEPDRAGTYHNALDDALHQARILLMLRSHISWT
jgi:hypothetical protein